MPAGTRQRDISGRLYEFIDVLRDADVPIAADEVLTLFTALPNLPFNDQVAFRQGLQTTLIKDYTDIPVFDKCFREFFIQAGRDMLALDDPGDEIIPRRGAPPPPPPAVERFTNDELERLDAMLDQFLDTVADEQLMRATSDDLLAQLLEALSQGDSGGTGMMFFIPSRGKGGGHGEPDEDDTNEIDPEIQRLLGRLLGRKAARRRVGREIKKREDYLLTKFIYQLKPAEIKEMRELVKRFGQKLKNRITLRKKRVKHGGIDIKRTLRTSLQYGGVPFRIFHKDKKIDRPQLVILCDISGSVNQYTRFMLLLTHTLQSLFSKVRTFAFISNLIEITPMFQEMDPERAINMIFQDKDFTYGWGTNYGKCFNQFMDEFSDAVNGKTTVLILGDARNNHQDPGLESFIAIRERARNVYWLNPEKRHLWDWSDSIATLYLKYCSDMKEVNNFIDLSHFIDQLFISYTGH